MFLFQKFKYQKFSIFRQKHDSAENVLRGPSNIYLSHVKISRKLASSPKWSSHFKKCTLFLGTLYWSIYAPSISYLQRGWPCCLPFGSTMGAATSQVPKGLGSQNPTKNRKCWLWLMWTLEFSGQLLSRNCVL